MAQIERLNSLRETAALWHERAGQENASAETRNGLQAWLGKSAEHVAAYRSIDLYYPDYSSASEAVTTPEAGAFFEAMARLSTGGVRVLFSDIEVPQH